VVAGELLEKKLVQVMSGSAEDLAVLLEGKVSGDLNTEAKKAQLAGLAAKKYQCVCCVNEGPQAFVSDGKREVVLNGGDTLLELLPGLGSVATSLYACCAAATQDMFAATVLGQILLSEGSVLARHFTEKKDGPGTFAVRLIDGVYNIVNHWDVFQMQMKKMQ
jgi:hydroxyethylthiazole kinase-like sugar kinase family protein